MYTRDISEVCAACGERLTDFNPPDSPCPDCGVTNKIDGDILVALHDAP